MPFDPGPIFLSLKLAFVTTVLLVFAGMPLAYWLAFSRSRTRPVFETFVAMPLILPPTVVGFYLLVLFGRAGTLGRLAEGWLDLRLVFSFEGLVAASLFYSLPFMVQPLVSGFRGVPVSLVEAALTLGKSRITTLLRVMLPNMRPAILTGLTLCFAHTIGEFGIVLMIGGSIPGETRVASIAIYDAVQGLDYRAANRYAFILFLITFLILLLVNVVNGRFVRSGHDRP
jgi:molybdate transport system permease protein